MYYALQYACVNAREQVAKRMQSNWQYVATRQFLRQLLKHDTLQCQLAQHIDRLLSLATVRVSELFKQDVSCLERFLEWKASRPCFSQATTT